MTDKDILEIMQKTGAEADELNKAAGPLGYGVTFRAGGAPGADSPRLYHRFNVHRIDQQPGSGPSFDTVDEVRTYLDMVAKWPRWRLDLKDDSIEFDPETRTITDRSTGESFSLRIGWGLGVTGSADIAAGERAGALEGATHLSVAAEQPPTIGQWYKSETA
jgi:hypothetical protein